MKKSKIKNKLKTIHILNSIFGYVSVIIIVWSNEIFDLPHLLLNAEATPINWVECLIETFCVSTLFIIYVLYVNLLLSKIKILEGCLSMCPLCRKVHTPQNEWIPIENYIRHNSEANFTHGVCPECKNSSNWL